MKPTIIGLCTFYSLYWLAMTMIVMRANRRSRWLAPSEGMPSGTGRISVVIPARNEEIDIRDSLRTVLAQQRVELDVIVVDDHSTDRTGEMLDRIASSDSRVKVLHDPPMQEGWLGKCNAMQYGAAEATGDYLLFSDADIMHHPSCFATVLAILQQENLDFLSLCPSWDFLSFWENVNVPICFFGVVKFLGTPGFESPDSPVALASGALMLVKKEVFHAVGGFQALKHEMADDVSFARLLKRRRYRTSYRLAPDCLRVRLFKDARQAFWGTTKNILMAVENHIWLGVPLALFALLQFATPLLAVALGALSADALLVAIGLATYALHYGSFFVARRVLRFDPWKLFGFPLVAIVATSCIGLAIYYRAKGAIHWRGRTIKVHN